MSSIKTDLQNAGFELIETHISWVFLGERDVFKVKRPVDFGFLDFTTLAKRGAACDAEVRLNRRLAPDIYLGVVPITLDPSGRHRLNGDGAPVEWAVHMRRLADEDRADMLLQAGDLSNAHVEALAAHIAEFHERSRCDPETTLHGSVEIIRANVEENFRQTQDCIEDYLSRAQADEVRNWQLRMLQEDGTFEARMEANRVRDGHGDLRLEHVYFRKDGSIAVIDCIEFNDRFRYADVCADLAFLSMDLVWHGRVDLAEQFLAQYARHTNDYDLYSVANFYESYRAFIRGKIASLLMSDPTTAPAVQDRARREARRYFLLALAFERPPAVAPQVVAVGGMIASGKSTVANLVSELLSAPVVSSDRTRKHLMGKGATESMQSDAWSDAYSEGSTERVYDELLRRTEVVVDSGRPVVVDASFRTQAMRRAIREVATQRGVPFSFVECVAPREVCLDRLRRRERGGTHESDARSDLLDEFAKNYEPVDELPAKEYKRLDTSRPRSENQLRLEELFVPPCLEGKASAVPDPGRSMIQTPGSEST